MFGCMYILYANDRCAQEESCRGKQRKGRVFRESEEVVQVLIGVLK